MSSYLSYDSIRHVKMCQEVSEDTGYMDIAHAKMPYGTGEVVL